MHAETAEEMPTPTENEIPSVEFIRAISDFLDTDPSDLLAELGYYDLLPTCTSACDSTCCSVTGRLAPAP